MRSRRAIAWLWLMGGLACASRAEPDAREEAPRGEAARVEAAVEVEAEIAPRSPTVPPGERPGELVVQRASGDQWVAVCRTQGEAGPQPRLVLDGGGERRLDQLEASDESGRFVLLTHGGQRWLFDTELHHDHDLGPLTHTIPGSFAAGLLAYGRRTGDLEELVLLDPLTHAERVLPSPRSGLHRVELDRSGHGLWLTTLEPDADLSDDPLDEPLRRDAARSPQHMCTTGPGCLSSSTAPRRLGLVWLEPTPTFVELDESPAHPRALAGAVVIESERGIELVYADRRETIAEPGCRLDPEHYDPEVLRLVCEQDDARVRIDRWHDGRREPWTACGP